MPLNAEARQAGDAGEAQRSVAHTARRPLIMCVDDEIHCRRAAKSVVERAGFAFIGVNSGTECLTLLHRVNPRVILMDIMMPEMDGYETCRRIRLNFRLVHARIIYI